MKKKLLLIFCCVLFVSSSIASHSPGDVMSLIDKVGDNNLQHGLSKVSPLFDKSVQLLSGEISGIAESLSLLPGAFSGLFSFFATAEYSFLPLKASFFLLTANIPATFNWYLPLLVVLIFALGVILWYLMGQIRLRRQATQRVDHYRDLLDAAPTAMLIFQDYKLKYVNSAMERLTGFSQQQLLSMEIWQLIHPQSLNDLNSENWFLRKNSQGMRMEFQIRTSTGEVVWVDFSAQLIDFEQRAAFLASALLIEEKKQFESKLIEAEERYSLIVLATNDGISDYNIDSDSLYLSSQWKQMLGYNTNEIESTLEAWLELIHPEEYNKALKMLKKIQSGEIPEAEREYRMRCKDGSYRWIRVKLSVVFDSHSKPVRVLGTHSDITQKKQTEEILLESEHRYKSLFSQNSAVMLITNPDTAAIEDANSAACEYYGYTQQELIKMNISDIICIDKDNEQADEFSPETLASNTLHMRHKLKSGAVRDVEVYNSKIEHRGRILNHCIIYDITRRKQIEIELKAAKEEAEAAVQAKSIFISSVSHEIRTPLNAIIGLADLMVSEEEISPSMEENLRSIKFSSDHLLGIINDVLDFSKLEAGKVGIDTTLFNLPKLLQDSINAVKFKAQEKNINLRVRINPDVPQAVQSDPSRLKQVLLNLLSNALKFTQEGHIDVYAKLTQSDGRNCRVRFAVSDTGIGIAESKQDKIFESFSQADANTFRKYGGTGLGLSISRKLVDLLGGEIGVKSIEGIGSTFWFEIPMEISEQTIAEDSTKFPAQQEDLSSMKVLMVEDDKMNQFVLSKILRRWKIKVDVADNGLEAIQKLESSIYNVVLMDLHMPVMDGYEAARRIRSGSSGVLNPAVPIIALTGDINKETHSVVREAGMNDYITKPCEQHILFQKLTRYGNLEKEKEKEKEKQEHLPEPSGNVSERKKAKSNIIKALWDIFDDDIEATRSMIRHFIKQVPENVSEAKEFLTQNNKDMACKSLHKVKPGFSYLGFPEISDLVENLQQLIRHKDDPFTVAQNILLLEKEIRKIVGMLHEVHKELETE